MKKLYCILIAILFTSGINSTLSAQNRLTLYFSGGDTLSIVNVDTVFYTWNDSADIASYYQHVHTVDTHFMYPVNTIDSMHYHGMVTQSGGIVDIDDPSGDGLLLITYESCQELEDTSFNISAYYSDKAQLMMVTTSDTMPLLLYWGTIEEGDAIVIDTTSTALALAAMHPTLIGAKGAQIDSLTSFITSTQAFPTLLHEIAIAVANRRTIVDTTNTALLDALSDVITQTLQSHYEHHQSKYTNFTSPLSISTSGSVASMKLFGLAPSYYGAIVDEQGQVIRNFMVETRDDYSALDLIFNRTIYGPEHSFDLAPYVNQAVYFRLSRTNGLAIFDFIYHTFVNPILEIIGLDSRTCWGDVIEDFIMNRLVDQVDNIVHGGGQPDVNMIVENVTRIILGELIPSLADILSDGFDERLGTVASDACVSNAPTMLRRIASNFCVISRVYGILRNSTNMAIRATEYFSNPDSLSFCLQYRSDGEVASCATLDIDLVSGGNQYGIADEVLDHAIAFDVTIQLDDESEYVSDEYLINVVLLSNEGTTNYSSKPILYFENNNGIIHHTDSVRWWLGYTNDVQTLGIVIVDPITNTPVTDTLRVNAFLRHPELTVVSGDNQYGVPGGTLSHPIILRLRVPARENQEAENMRFYPIRLIPQPNSGTVANTSLTTNLDGEVAFYWTLGQTQTVQHLKAVALYPDTQQPSSDTIEISATLMHPVLERVSGHNQYGDVDSLLSAPIEVVLYSSPNINDNSRHPLSDYYVRLDAASQCGTTNNNIVITDADGHIQTSWTLGSKTDSVHIVATAFLDSTLTTQVGDTIHIDALIRTPQASLTSGGNQSAGSDLWLPDSVVFNIVSIADGILPNHPLTSYPVKFFVVDGNGLLASSPNGTTSNEVIKNTDNFGNASIYWQLSDSAETHRIACVALNPHTMQPWGDTAYCDASSGEAPYFSISATKRAQFAPGNLQYNPSSNTWRFALHQYDYIGTANLNLTNNDNSYAGWIDAFSWATRNMPTYVPTNNSMYDNGFDQFFDWATHPISNGGNQSFVWRTPTFGEWNYVINNRPNASSLVAYGTVVGVHGMILLPDNWVLPANVSFSPLSYDWVTNVYDSTAWQSMEAAGAIFLPAAGYRGPQNASSTTLTIVNMQNAGYYWSANGYKNYPTYGYNYTQEAYRMGFFGNLGTAPNAMLHQLCYYGLSVRPLKEIAEQ